MIKKLLYIIFGLLIASSGYAALNFGAMNCGDADATTWCVDSEEITVTDADCDGDCAGGDTIYLESGARGDIEFHDLDGGGSYITITNEEEEQVVFTENGDASWSTVVFKGCQYIDFRGDNSSVSTSDLKVYLDTEGFVLSGASSDMQIITANSDAGSLTDHIKISYVEFNGGGAIRIGGDGATEILAAKTYSVLEFHHIYLQNVGYSAFYAGDNDAGVTAPSMADISIHDAIMEDNGCYGITVKGVAATSSYVRVYNNVIRGSGGGQSTGVSCGAGPQSRRHGIGFAQPWLGPSYGEVYNNWIEKTEGSCIKLSDANDTASPHKAYDNILLGCGTGDDATFGNAIAMIEFSKDNEIYDNIILDATRYAAYTKSTARPEATISRNWVGATGDGSGNEGYGFESSDSEDIVLGTGEANANEYHSSVSSFNFNTWSTGSDYTNDRFMSRDLSPADGAEDVAVTASLTWVNFPSVDSVDDLTLYYECEDDSPDNEVVPDTLTSYNPPGNINPGQTCYWQLISHIRPGITAEQDETGAVYSFTTEGNPRRIIMID